MAVARGLPETNDVILGRYVIQEQIGRGGFGVVYKAVQTGLQRTVALKMLLPSAMVHEDMVERFRREAVLARNLNHPNTIRLYDFGQTEGGLLFIAMECLEGRALDSLVKDHGPLELERVQHIGVQILKSLAEAHQHGIIHRDIKPSNIFVCDNVVGEQDFVKVLDFGIAKAFGEKESNRLTQTGVGFGTPYYMAPEQVRGKDICPATDLYSLGLLMTEMLTGKTVYTGESSMDVAVKQLSEEAPPLPEWVLRGPLGPVLQRATQKDIHLRYPSAVEMLRDLRSVDPHASIDVSAKVNTRDLEPVAAPASKTPFYIAAAAIIFLLLVGVGVGSLVLYNLIIGDDGDPPPIAEKVVETPEKGIKDEIGGLEKATEDKGSLKGAPKDTAEEKKAARVKVSVKSEPSGASVFHGEDYLGVTPAVLEMEPSDSGTTLRIEMEAFEEHMLEVSLDKDGEYEARLEPVKSAPIASSKKPIRGGKNNRPPTTNKRPEKKNTEKKGTTKKTTEKKETEKKPVKIVIPKLD